MVNVKKYNYIVSDIERVFCKDKNYFIVLNINN